MKIDWNALKNNKALNIAFIIFVPTIIVGAVYGVKYYNKRKNPKADPKAEENFASGSLQGKPTETEVEKNKIEPTDINDI